MLKTLFSLQATKAWLAGLFATLLPFVVEPITAFVIKTLGDNPAVDENATVTAILVGILTLLGVYAVPNAKKP